MKNLKTYSSRQVVIYIILTTFVISTGITGVEWRFNLINRISKKVASFQVTPTSNQTIATLEIPSPTPTSIIPLSTSTPIIPLSTSTPIIPLVPYAFRDNSLVFNALTDISAVPTKKDLTIAPGEDIEYLQSVLDKIFPSGIDGLTDEKISIEILRYVSTKMLLKTNTGTATKMLQEGHAICGGMSISFQALVRLAGVPARYVGIFGLPKIGNHAIAEVYYEGGWHLFDPTVGLIFYSEPEFNGKGKIPSLAELRSGAQKPLYLFKVVEQPWTGVYDPQVARSIGIIRVEDDYLSKYYQFDFIQLYWRFFSVAFPVTSEQLPILSFPVDVDFNQGTRYSIGELDASEYDVLVATAGDETAGRVGTRFVGGGGIEEVQTWFIKSASPGYFRITYSSTESEPPQLILFPLKAIYIVSASQKGNEAEFIFHMSDTDAAVQFWVEDGIFWIDKWEAEWLGENIDSIEIP